MTLQYRIRSKFEDENWRERCIHCLELLLHYSEHWCKECENQFPVAEFVSRLLFLFSRRCALHQTTVRTLLSRPNSDPMEEYRTTWPQRSEEMGQELVGLLQEIVEDAISEWESAGFSKRPHSVVVDQIVAAIVHQQYVVFHHNQTTRRDINHWGI